MADAATLLESLALRLRERAESRMAELSHAQTGLSPRQLGDVQLLTDIADDIEATIHAAWSDEQ